MELRQYLRIVRARIGLIVVITILVTGIGFAISNLLPPVYQATTSVLVDPGGSSGARVNDVLASEQLAIT